VNGFAETLAMIKIAQLGAGRMGGVHARNAAANLRLDLAFVVDPKPQAAQALAAEVGARPASFEAVLADPSILGVVIASSTAVHLENTLACLAAGKAVFCEKPLDLDPRRLESAKAQLTAPAARLFVAFNRRFDHQFRTLKARLAAGDVGILETLHIVSHDPAPPPPAFIPTSGGLFKDFTIHDFDTARWLLGEEPREVFAFAGCLVDPAIGAAGDVDTAKILLRTPTDRLVVISNTRRSGYGYDQRVEAFGAGGRLAVDNIRLSTVDLWREAGALAEPIQPGFMTRYAQAYRDEMDHFADILEDGSAPLTGYDDSLAALVLAEAAGRSVQTGAPVRL
jgi:myo-inositol 2-dehydrogenase/D-chiro-inositol 1-dehydrogenase